MELLGIPGSLRAGSLNRRLLHAAASELPVGIDLGLYDELASLPPYDEDHDLEPPATVAAWRSAVAAADAVLIATPEYNHSIPGQLKNALDWASRPWPDNPLVGKPVAVIGASPSPFGAAWAQAETRKVLTAIGARVVERELAVAHAGSAFTDDARLADPGLRRELAAVLDDLAAAVPVASLVGAR